MQIYPTGYAESHRMAEQIFREILPQHGMAVREEQIALCHEVLDTLYNKEISLCEAGVGPAKRWPTLWPVFFGKCTDPTGSSCPLLSRLPALPCRMPF